MIVKIEFDTDVNSSFVEFGMSEDDVLVHVLKHIQHDIQSGSYDVYNDIQKDNDSYPIGMYSVRKS